MGRADTLEHKLAPEFRMLSGLVLWDVCTGERTQLLGILTSGPNRPSQGVSCLKATW